MSETFHAVLGPEPAFKICNRYWDEDVTGLTYICLLRTIIGDYYCYYDTIIPIAQMRKQA